MLVSMLAAFLFERHFSRKFYALFIVAYLLLISFSSVGVPDAPVPLSFPFFALSYVREGTGWTAQYYQLYFVTLVFQESMVQYKGFGDLVYSSGGDYILYFSFFLLVNLAGATIGYWTAKGAIRNTLAKMKQKIKRNPTLKNEPEALIYIFGKPERLVV